MDLFSEEDKRWNGTYSKLFRLHNSCEMFLLRQTRFVLTKYVTTVLKEKVSFTRTKLLPRPLGLA